MKRFWPVFLALFCWLMVLIVPATRHGVWAGWDNWTAYNRYEYIWSFAWVGSPPDPPTDKRGEIFMAMVNESIEQYDDLAQRYPNDALIASLQLSRAARDLQCSRDRDNGPVSNPTYPVVEDSELPVESPLADRDRMMAIAQRGQSIEPQNGYFDGFLIYGLYATRRDEEAHRALKAAARKTIYDSHGSEATLNTANVLNGIYNIPTPPLQLKKLSENPKDIISYHLRKVNRWTMDTAIFDRIAGRHQEALDTASDLLKFGRTIRLDSALEFDSELGFECEEAALLEAAVPDENYPKPDPQDENGPPPLAEYQLYPRSLYVYAKQHKRDDIAKLASSEWIEMQGSTKIYKFQESLKPSQSPAVSQVVYANRLQSLLLKSIFAAFLPATIFGLLSWRFGVPAQAKSPFWQGAIATFPLPAIAFAGMYYRVPLENTIERFSNETEGLSEFGTLMPIYVPVILLYLGLQQAGRWQREQQDKPLPIKTRLKNLTAPATDGLARFDFGWIVGQILNFSYWLLVAAAIIIISLNFEVTYPYFHTSQLKLYRITLAVALLPFIILRLVSWCQLPRRHETLLLSFRTISQVAGGYLVTASVLYAILAFVTLGITLNYTRKFETETRMGEMKTLRAEMGLNSR